MRVESHGQGSIMHVMKRGARGMNIVRDEGDCIRFAKSLFLLNDAYNSEHWLRDALHLPLGERPMSWPERKPLVSILAWTLLPNHFHILTKELEEGGVAKFMQRLCGSMTLSFNARHGGQGSIFQGGYKGKTVQHDVYLRQVFNYIVAKNVLEMHPGGLGKAMMQFDTAWDRAVSYPHSSLGVSAGVTSSPIIDVALLESLGLHQPGDAFKSSAKEMLKTHMNTRSEEFKNLLLEAW